MNGPVEYLDENFMYDFISDRVVDTCEDYNPLKAPAGVFYCLYDFVPVYRNSIKGKVGKYKLHTKIIQEK